MCCCEEGSPVIARDAANMCRAGLHSVVWQSVCSARTAGPCKNVTWTEQNIGPRQRPQDRRSTRGRRGTHKVLSDGECLHRAVHRKGYSVCHFTERPRKTPGLAPKLLRRRHRQSACTLSPMVLTCHLVAGAVEGCKKATTCVRDWLQHACLVGNLDRGAAQVLTLLVRIVEGEGRRGAVLPRLRAEVVIEARASRHRLGVEVRREGAVLPGGRERRSARQDKPVLEGSSDHFMSHHFSQNTLKSEMRQHGNTQNRWNPTRGPATGLRALQPSTRQLPGC